MKGRGHQKFADELARFAVGHADPRVTAIARRTGAPLRVGVRGRRGVGCGTVARALARAGGPRGVLVQSEGQTGPQTGGAAPVDVVVYVTAEVIKPEDTAAIAAAGHPLVAVLNKADLSGHADWSSGGPCAAAHRRCAELSSLAGVPMEPMIGLLAVAALTDLDGASWQGLRTLATTPGGSACLDGSHSDFLAADNPVASDLRLRLLDTLDLFGVALGMAALRRGRTPAQVRSLLRLMSGVDAVLDGISAAGAAARYQRVLDAVADLEALAVGDESISGFLSGDAAVLARMAAAVDLAEAAGLEEACSADGAGGAGRDDPATHLSRAVRWQRYSHGSVSQARRASGADIARGSLRLWSRARETRLGERR